MSMALSLALPTNHRTGIHLPKAMRWGLGTGQAAVALSQSTQMVHNLARITIT